MDLVWIGIGINIFSDNPLFQQLSELASLLAKFEGVAQTEFHLNLYDVDIPKANLEKMKQALEAITTRHQTFKLQLRQINFFNHGTVFIECSLPQELKDLEQKVVETVNPLREGVKTQDYWQPWRQYNQEQLVNREKFGNPNVLNCFNPHITLGFVKKPVNELEKIVNQLNQSWVPQILEVNQIDLAVQYTKGQTAQVDSFPFIWAQTVLLIF